MSPIIKLSSIFSIGALAIGTPIVLGANTTLPPSLFTSKNYKNNCYHVITDKNQQKQLLVCSSDKGGEDNFPKFYLYSKENNPITLQEIKSLHSTEQDANHGLYTISFISNLNDQKLSETITVVHEKWDDLNDQPLTNNCSIVISQNSPHLRCNGKYGDVLLKDSNFILKE